MSPFIIEKVNLLLNSFDISGLMDVVECFRFSPVLSEKSRLYHGDL